MMLFVILVILQHIDVRSLFNELKANFDDTLMLNKQNVYSIIFIRDYTILQVAIVIVVNYVVAQFRIHNEVIYSL